MFNMQVSVYLLEKLWYDMHIIIQSTYSHCQMNK